MHRPGLPAAVPAAVPVPDRSMTGRDPHAEPPWLENGPSTLSVVSTSWLARGTTPGWSSFLPIFDQLRPRNDISNSLSAGPVVSDAMLTNRMTCRVGASGQP